jgi:hypothetical protein
VNLLARDERDALDIWSHLFDLGGDDFRFLPTIHEALATAQN